MGAEHRAIIGKGAVRGTRRENPRMSVRAKELETTVRRRRPLVIGVTGLCVTVVVTLVVLSATGESPKPIAVSSDAVTGSTSTSTSMSTTGFVPTSAVPVQSSTATSAVPPATTTDPPPSSARATGDLSGTTTATTARATTTTTVL